MTIEKKETWNFILEGVWRALSGKSKDYLSHLQATVCSAFIQWSGNGRCRSCLLANSEPGQHLPQHLLAVRYRVSARQQPAAGRELEPKW